MDPIIEAYEKYKHMDEPLSDPKWIKGADFKYQVITDLWRAVKSHVAKCAKKV